MVVEQPIQAQKCLSVINSEYQTSALMTYVSLGSSSTTTTQAVSHTAPVPPWVNPMCLTLNSYLGTIDVFFILCRLSLTDARVSFSINMLQLPIVNEFNFRVRIHAHVPRYFLLNTFPLPVVDLGTELLPVDAIMCIILLMRQYLLQCYLL